MPLTAVEFKNQGNQYYSTKQSSLAIESYNEAIQLLENNSDENLQLYLLYLNRSAAYIQDKNYYFGYKDAKHSLLLKKDENFKGFYRAAICAYHLGFIEQSEKLIKQATSHHQENLLDYLNLKLLIEKKVNIMNKYQKSNLTAKQSIKILEDIIQKQNSLNDLPSILYYIRYLLRAFFEKKKDKKLMDMKTGNLGLRLHELAVEFNYTFNVEKLMSTDSIFEDLILNEMPDVGPLRLQAYEQRKLPGDKRDFDLEMKSGEDLTAYEFSFFINNIIASLVVNCSNESVSLCALKQLHRLTTIDLYRQALGDALSDAINNYIYSQSKNSLLFQKLVSNNGVEIFFYDYIEAACQNSAARMIKNLTADHWKIQSLKTIEFVLKQISKKIRHDGLELIEPREASKFELEMKKALGIDSSKENDKENFSLIVNVLTKIYMTCGRQPFLNRANIDPLFLFVNQIWFQEFSNDQRRYDIPFLLNGWKSVLTKWLKLDYKNQKKYIQQINTDLLDDDD